jgi:hypothetical protein
MPKKMDRRLVSREKHEIAYLARKFRTSQKVIRAAHKAVGRSRKRVEAYVAGFQATEEALD